MSAKALKISATVAVVVLALTGLLFTTLREDTAVLQARGRGDERPGGVARAAAAAARLRRAGSSGSADSLDYRFNVQSNGSVVQASYSGVVPDTFKEGAEVVLKGTLSPDGFHVERNGVMAKCPSKYEPSKADAGRTAAPPNTSGS